MLSILYNIIISPLELVFEFVFEILFRILGQGNSNQGFAVIGVSIAISLLTLPLYRRADAVQQKERDIQKKLSHWVSHIKKTFKGDERYMMLQTYYRENNYSPIMALNGSLSLLLEIPFFMAAYHFLSHLEVLNGASFGLISDLGKADGLIKIGNFSINVLPILMTLINCISSAIYLKGFPVKDKIQTYGMALIFLVLLYNSPSGLVVYWTCNNIFSLVKNVFYKLKNPKKVLWAMSCCFLATIILFAFFRNPHSFGWIKSVLISFFFICINYPILRKLYFEKKNSAKKFVFDNKKVIYRTIFSLSLFTLMFAFAKNPASFGIIKCMLFVFCVTLLCYPYYKIYLKKMIASKNELMFNKINFKLILFCALLPIECFIVAPAELYLTNRSEFPMRLFDVFGTLVLVTLCFTLLNLFLYKKLPNIVKNNFIIFLSSLFICTFMQSQFLPNSLGVLDGSKILLSSHIAKLIISAVAWLFVIIGFHVLYKKINLTIFKNIIHFFVLLTCIGNIAVLIRANRTVDVDSIEMVRLAKRDQWTVSRNKNVIVFLLDAFRAELFEEIVNDSNLSVKEDFEDFTFYPDAISEANRTVYSVPAIFSGKVNEKQLPFGEYIRDVYPSSAFGKEISSGKYNINIFTDPHYVDCSGKTNIDNLTNNINNNFNAITKIKLTKKMVELSLFKLTPVFLKNCFWVATSDFQKIVSSDYTNIYAFDDVLFYRELCEKKLTPKYPNTCFRFFHLDGAHVPYTMNENCERLDNGQTDMKHQAMGSLKIVKKYIDYLKDLGLYENSTIFIIADHGWEPGINAHVNPIFLLKEAGVSKNFSVSDSYISFFDMSEMFVKALKSEKIDLEKNFARDKSEPRYFYYHSYAADREPNTIYKYEVNGSIKNIENVREINESLFYGVKKNNGNYKLNTKLYFTTEGTANPYCDDGFDRNELNGTWTQSNTASMEFNIGKISSDLVLEMDFNVFESGQKSYLYANDNFIAEIKKDNGPIYIDIPKKYLNSDTGKLVIRFELPDAKQYYNRKLTYFMHYLKIKEKK